MIEIDESMCCVTAVGIILKGDLIFNGEDTNVIHLVVQQIEVIAEEMRYGNK